MSYFLKKQEVDHIVFERGKIGESWRSQRWDSFAINTPAWASVLPGDKHEGGDPDGFYLRDEFVDCLNKYAAKFELPVIENTKVVSLEPSDNSAGRFKVTVSNNHTASDEYFCSNVVVASGIMNEKRIPPQSANISPGILQLHASEFRNPSRLPDGAVLVVGSAQSGVQITEDLLGAGRKVYLSTSQVPRAPRRYKGKDAVYWMLNTGFWDVETSSVTDPQVFATKNPQISGVGMLGHSVSLQSLAKAGVVILGKLARAEGDTVFFQPNAAEHVRFADEFSKKLKDTIDEFITKNSISAPPAEYDEADLPDLQASCASDIQEMNLSETGISAIVWTTGFGSDFSWINLPVIDEKGNPKHTNGISEIDGLYFLGFPWLRKRKSGIINGIAEDAEFIANKIVSVK
jgi:putative flavoprotein involved in K+ transport